MTITLSKKAKRFILLSTPSIPPSVQAPQRKSPHVERIWLGRPQNQFGPNSNPGDFWRLSHYELDNPKKGDQQHQREAHRHDNKLAELTSREITSAVALGLDTESSS
jgi:hypothetical protein